MNIALLSDTHGHMDIDILNAISGSDLVLHAGDIGSHDVCDQIESVAPLIAVYGNIDDQSIRYRFPKHWKGNIENCNIMMTHIGGYPGRYPREIRDMIVEFKPDLFICGHSHILKVMRDHSYHLLHLNPGACGHHGFHLVRTLMKFQILNSKVLDLKIIELGNRGQIH